MWPTTALVFRAMIDRPDRFRRSRAVCTHLGLTSVRYQGWRDGHPGQGDLCGDELARTAFMIASSRPP
ncbi:IS110 family transposase [Mesorhizobium camelthorni]|uniref:IS110 family transposase n=1 Tax=Allomesorhizobium camelthorni TaxID=475069 RepID=A0A6G4WDG5_9HYPH|nr:IS110 family transposase [Mesorhizobium camelthorni]